MYIFLFIHTQQVSSQRKKINPFNLKCSLFSEIAKLQE